MIRTFFAMVLSVLVGLATGYVLWGTRLGSLTEALSTLTLEQDTLRARLGGSTDGGAAPSGQAAEQLRVVNESLAAIRQELAEQKALLGKPEAAVQPDGAEAKALHDQLEACRAEHRDGDAAAAQLSELRIQLEGCIADKKDLEMRAAPAPSAVPPPAAPRTEF